MRSRILLTRSNLRYYAIWIGIAVFSIELSQIGDLRLRRANERGAEDAAGANAGRAAENGFRAYGLERRAGRDCDWADDAETAG